LSLVADPRLATAPPPAPGDVVKRLAAAQRALATLIIAALRPVWPSGVNGTFTVTFYDGHAKVKFDMPASKEAGYRD
jgi:hypothetical protein